MTGLYYCWKDLRILVVGGFLSLTLSSLLFIKNVLTLNKAYIMSKSDLDFIISLAKVYTIKFISCGCEIGRT